MDMQRQRAGTPWPDIGMSLRKSHDRFKLERQVDDGEALGPGGCGMDVVRPYAHDIAGLQKNVMFIYAMNRRSAFTPENLCVSVAMQVPPATSSDFEMTGATIEIPVLSRYGNRHTASLCRPPALSRRHPAG